MTDYKKAFEDLQKQLQEQDQILAIKDMILEIGIYMEKSKISDDEKMARLLAMPSMTIPEIQQLHDILKKEIQDYNDIYLKALQAEQEK